MVQYESSHSSYFCIKTGVSQGSDLSSDLFNIYTAHMPVTTNTIIVTYVDDTVILCTRNDEGLKKHPNYYKFI